MGYLDRYEVSFVLLGDIVTTDRATFIFYRSSFIFVSQRTQTYFPYLSMPLSPSLWLTFITNMIVQENAERVYTVYSAWINALDGDQIAFLNQRIGGYSSVPQVPPEVDAL